MILLIISAVLCILVVHFIWQHRRVSDAQAFLCQKHVLITGGSSGIGFALAKFAHSNGANVTLVARNVDRLEQAKLDLSKHSGGSGWIEIISLDITFGFDCLKRAFTLHMTNHGVVDVLINCAGYAVSRTFVETPVEAIDGMTRTNYLASLYVTKSILPFMLEGSAEAVRHRRVAFLSSMAGQAAIYGFAAYAGSKFALRGFAEALSMELQHTGPLVTVGYPPDTDTPGFQAENVGKPAATLALSSSGGLASSKDVARRLFNDIIAGKLVSYFGAEGAALALATSGVLPPVTLGGRLSVSWLLATFAEALLAMPLRLFGIAFALYTRHVVHKHTIGKSMQTCQPTP